jgi:hypothetical protein
VKDRMLQALVVLTVLVGSALYFGSPQKALAQSTQKTIAIVNTTPCTLSNGTCTAAIDWPEGGFVDNNYAPVCNASFILNGALVTFNTPLILSHTNTTITVEVAVGPGFDASTPFVNCIGVHN